jgi:2,3-bisphosphoglycerate-dependent phosphoglycerate mutase
MQFYFIRHGQSENNALWRRSTDYAKVRNEDPGLTEVGRQQAEFLAQFLQDTTAAIHDRDHQNIAGFGITHLYSSLMLRAVATGTIIAKTLDLPLVAWEDLHERGGIYLEDEQTGEYIGQPGKNRAYFETHYPDFVLPDSLGEAGWWNRPFEEPEQRLTRVKRFWRDLLERHGRTDDRVAVISHGGFHHDLLTTILNLPETEGHWFALNNAAMTRLDFNDDRIGLIYLNRMDFLPKELIT